MSNNGVYIDWRNPTNIQEARRLVRETGDLNAAAEQLSKMWGRTVTASKIKDAFDRHGIDYQPLLRMAEAEKAVDPSMLSDDELTDHIAFMIKQCAEQMKLAPQDVTWVDFKHFAEYYWGHGSKQNIKPRHITRVGGFAAIRDAYFPPQSTEFSQEREELRHKSQLHRSVSLMETVNSLLLRQIEEVAERAFGGKVQPSKFALKKHDVPISRTLNAIWSDLHFQSLLDSREVNMPYGTKEEARRFAAVCVQMADWKPQYRAETSLRVLAIGDWIQNQLYDMRDGAPLAEQAIAAIHYGIHGISFLSQHYHNIEVLCTPGNHGRFTSRHSSRATVQKWDALETVIYYSIMKACKHLPNVRFNVQRRAFVTWDSFGIMGYATHGDTHFDPGYPGNIIRTKALANHVNAMNVAVAHDKRYKLIACGHVHTANVLHMNNGSKLITNAALIPSDQYAESIGIPDTQCGQMIFESTPKFIVGDNRLAEVGPDTDKDATLEQVIPQLSDF